MIIVTHRANLLLALSIGMLLTLIVRVAFLEKPSITTMASPLGNRTICVDAGHGSPDGGAVSDSGTTEKEINLSIAMKLKELLEASGARCVMTRTDDFGIYDPQMNTIRDKKRSDLNNRKKIMEQSDIDIVVSIHLNKFEQSQYFGAQVFYAPDNVEGQRLGRILQKSLIDILQNGNTRVAKSVPEHVFVLKDITKPATIIECGFLSNYNEEQLLKTEQYQMKLAWSIYMGLMQYYEPVNQ